VRSFTGTAAVNCASAARVIPNAVPVPGCLMNSNAVLIRLELVGVRFADDDVVTVSLLDMLVSLPFPNPSGYAGEMSDEGTPTGEPEQGSADDQAAQAAADKAKADETAARDAERAELEALRKERADSKAAAEKAERDQEQAELAELRRERDERAAAAERDAAIATGDDDVPPVREHAFWRR
jgi:hypothetical protein